MLYMTSQILNNRFVFPRGIYNALYRFLYRICYTRLDFFLYKVLCNMEMVM